MHFVIELSDRTAIRHTYGDCQKWREKGGVLRRAAPKADPWDPTGLLPGRKWHTVLELGCGLKQWIKGLIANAAADSVIYACDLSEDVLRVFSEEFRVIESKGETAHHCVLADGEKLPFKDRVFDGVSAVFVGPHMKDAETFVKGLACTLKPGGWLLTNSVDWRNPPPDFPSQALQKLLGGPASFIVRNKFDEESARDALNRHFVEVRENRVVIQSMLTTVEQLLKLHSRQEYFIRGVLPPSYSWDDYFSCVKRIAEEYFRRNGAYCIDLPITYFFAERPRVCAA